MKMTRRSALATAAGTCAATFAIENDLLAGAQIDFTPLQLNSNGRQQVDSRVSVLDKHEDEMLDHLLTGNTQAEKLDLNHLNADFSSLVQNPGRPVNFNQQNFQSEAVGCQRLIQLILQRQSFGWNSVSPCVKLIDFFVGHWYPCNDIVEIGVCENKIWNCLNGQFNANIVKFYTQHMIYELNGLCQFHTSPNPLFAQQRQQLFGLCQQFMGNIGGAQRRQSFMRFTTATSLFCRKYYPQWV